jgi:hypothetical protein
MVMLWAILIGQENKEPIYVTSAKIINNGAIISKYVKICDNIF